MQQSAAKPDEIQLGQVIAISNIRAEAHNRAINKFRSAPPSLPAPVISMFWQLWVTEQTSPPFCHGSTDV